MDANIKKALIALLKEEVIVASWGLCKITVNDTSVKFEVSGFIYQGIVIIEIRNSKYKISFNDRTIMFCSTNNIVQMLDSKIEKGDEYKTISKNGYSVLNNVSSTKICWDNMNCLSVSLAT